MLLEALVRSVPARPHHDYRALAQVVWLAAAAGLCSGFHRATTMRAEYRSERWARDGSDKLHDVAAPLAWCRRSPSTKPRERPVIMARGRLGILERATAAAKARLRKLFASVGVSNCTWRRMLTTISTAEVVSTTAQMVPEPVVWLPPLLLLLLPPLPLRLPPFSRWSSRRYRASAVLCALDGGRTEPPPKRLVVLHARVVGVLFAVDSELTVR